MVKSNKTRELIIIAFFTFLTFLIIGIWFRDGKMYGGGEMQIPFYHPDYIFERNRYLWWDSIGTGIIKMEWFASFWFFGAANFLFTLSQNGVFTQAVFFGLVFLCASTFMYFLVKELTGKSQSAFIATLFYLFNPYVMSSVWHRFLFPIFALFGLMPLFTLFFIKGVRSGKFYFAILSVISCSVLSIVYMSPGLLVTLMLPSLIFLIGYIWRNKDNILKIKRAFLFSIFLGMIWLSFNLWWLIPYLSVGPLLIDNAMTLEGHLGSLEGVSREISASYNLRGMSPHYFFAEPVWGSIYASPIFKIISWVGPLIVFVGAWKGWRKYNWIKYFVILSLVGLFLGKGSNPPLGKSFYTLLFTHVPPSRVFRNPHEKLGLLVPFGYSILYAYGLLQIWAYNHKLNKKYLANLVAALCILLPIGVYVWPMWAGKVISLSLNKPAYVVVPSYYTELDQFLNSDGSDFRTLILPMMGHGIYQEWGDTDYVGGELSRDIFKKNVLSRSIDLPNWELFYNINFQFDKKSFSSLIDMLNIKYIIVRDDIDFSALELPDPREINAYFLKNKDLSPVKGFGKLTVYKNLKWKELNHVSAEKNYKVADNYKQMFDEMDKGSNIFVSESDASILKTVDMDTPSSLLYEKISPEEYTVKVRGAIKPFILVFDETYHPEWQASARSEYLKHFEVNNYANGFLIEQTGDFDINLDFAARNYVEKGKEIGKLIFLFSLIPLSWLLFMKKNTAK